VSSVTSGAPEEPSASKSSYVEANDLEGSMTSSLAQLEVGDRAGAVDEAR
jgi:hypothetical protein